MIKFLKGGGERQRGGRSTQKPVPKLGFFMEAAERRRQGSKRSRFHKEAKFISNPKITEKND